MIFAICVARILDPPKQQLSPRLSVVPAPGAEFREGGLKKKGKRLCGSQMPRVHRPDRVDYRGGRPQPWTQARAVARAAARHAWSP